MVKKFKCTAGVTRLVQPDQGNQTSQTSGAGAVPQDLLNQAGTTRPVQLDQHNQTSRTTPGCGGLVVMVELHWSSDLWSHCTCPVPLTGFALVLML